MNLRCFSIVLATLVLLAGGVKAQESAAVKITIMISDKTPSFSKQRLVVMLHRNHPGQGDRGDAAVDSYIDQGFSHQAGKKTVVTVTLGAKAKMIPGVQYKANVTVFRGETETCIGEVDGARGPFPVVSDGAPRAIAVTLRPTR